MARTFKSPDTDTLTAEKIELTNQKIIDYLIQSKNNEAAQYVSFLIKNLDGKKAKTDTSKYDKLLFVNQKILKVLEEIENNMIDEQDTSIKHLAKTSKQAASISTVLSQNEAINGSFGINDNGGLDLSDIAAGAGSMYLLKKLKDKFKKIRTTSTNNKSKPNKNKTTSKETIKKNKTLQKTQQKVNTQQNKTIKEAEKVKKDIKKTVEKQVKDVKKQQTIKAQSKPTKTSNSNINKNVQNASKGKKPNKTAVNNAKKASKSVSNGSTNKTISKSLAKSAGKGLSKLAGPAAVAVDVAMTVSDVLDANSDAERNEAITSGVASTAAGVTGAIALSWIPVIGPLAGYALGSWLGNWAGKGIAELFTDPEDNIPDEITKMGPEAELAFLDNVLIPKYQTDPNIDEKDRKEDLKSLNTYRKKLQDKIAKGFTQEEQDDFALGKLEFAGVFEKNFFGDSEILDWDKLEQCSIKDLQLLIDLDDWDDDTLEKLKQIKLLKQNKESEKKQQSSTTSSIDSINKAIQAEKQNLQKAVEKQDTLEVQKVQATLESLDQAKQTALSSKDQVDKVVNVKQSALDPMKKVKVSKSSDIDYDLNNNNKVQQAEQNLQQNLKMAMASGLGDMSFMMVDNSQMSAEASQAIANMKPSNTKFNPDDGLGAISGKYESNGKPGVISSGAKDKGGKSYGAWQIASKTGTLRAYVNFAKDKYPMLTTAPLASNAFDQIWKGIAAKDPQGFLQNQYEFIKKTHYDPVYDYAVSKGLDVSNKAVCSALWSQSVQHGLAGNKIIINRALKQINGSKDPAVIIRALYSARSQYVSGLDMDADTKASVLNRYKREVGDALSMNQQIQSGQLQNNAYEQASANARQSQNLTPSPSENSSVVENSTNVAKTAENSQSWGTQGPQPRKTGLEFDDEDIGDIDTEHINSQIQKIDNEINSLQKEYNIEKENQERANNTRIRTNLQFVDEEVLEQNPIKIQELQKRKQELLSQLPSVDKSASENAINAISDNMANNTVNSAKNSQTVVINNQNVQQAQNNVQRKDDVTEPNMCTNAFNNNI